MNPVNPDSTVNALPQTASVFPRIFISYSRHEFYFAESFSIRLQHSGLSVWFDSQQIALGENWSQDIQDGLAGSGILVLVASQASIASPYVAKEWESALEKGKPIHVVFFEAVDLPPELLKSAASIIDARSGFEVNYPRLLACIKGETTHHDPLPTKPKFGLPSKLSPSLQALVISRIWLSIIYILAIVIQASLLLRQSPYVSLILVGSAVVFTVVVILPVRSLWRVLRRKFVHRDVIYITAYAELLLLGYSIFPTNNGLYTLISMGYFLYWLQVVRQAKWNIDLLNWYPLTAQPPTQWRAIVQRPYLNQEMDIQINAPVMGGEEPQYPRLAKPVETKPVEPKWSVKWFGITIEQAKPVPAPPAVITRANSKLKGTTYHLYHAPIDTKNTSTLKQWLKYFGLNETSEAENADYTMLYLSHRTSKAFAYQLSEKHPNLICILAESIKVPQDTPASFKGIQWFDYRTRQNDRLYAALDALGDTSESVRAVQSLNTIPPQLSNYTMSRELENVWNTFGCVGTGCLGLGLTGLAFITGVIAVGTLNIRVLLAFLIVLALLANAVFFYYTAWHAAAYRPIHRNIVRIGLIGGLVSVFVIPWLATSISPIADFFTPLIIVIIAILVTVLIVIRISYWDWRKRLSPDADAFGTPDLRISPNWLSWQVAALLLGIFVLNTLWTGKIAFAEFIANLIHSAGLVR